MFKINQFLRNYTKNKNSKNSFNSENCLINSLFDDSKLDSYFNKKHIEDLNNCFLPPDHIELKQPEPDIVLEIFNLLTKESPETRELDIIFKEIISKARVCLMKLRDYNNREYFYSGISEYFIRLGDTWSQENNKTNSYKCYLMAIKTDPGNYLPYYKMAQMLKKFHGSRLLSLYYLHKSSELSPKIREIKFDESVCRILIKDLKGGFRDLNNLLRSSENSEEVFISLIETLVEEGLLKISAVLINYNKNNNVFILPEEETEISDLFGIELDSIFHFRFRNNNYYYEETIREISRLINENSLNEAKMLLIDTNYEFPQYSDEINLYESLILEKEKKYSEAFNFLENFMKKNSNDDLLKIAVNHYKLLSLKLFNRKIEIRPLRSKESHIIINRNNLWDSIISISDIKIVDNEIYLSSGFHEIRINFLSETKFFTVFLEEKQSYKLNLIFEDGRYSMELKKTIAIKNHFRRSEQVKHLFRKNKIMNRRKTDLSYRTSSLSI